jgi:CRP-like cAMP-binding protein
VIEHHHGLQVKTDFHTYAPGETIIRQGDTADRFYVLLKGKVDILKAQPGQAERRVAMLTPPRYFGEIGLLRTVKRTATVRVADDSEPVELLSLDWHTFMYLVSHYDLTSEEIMELVLQQQSTRELRV